MLVLECDPISRHNNNNKRHEYINKEEISDSHNDIFRFIELTTINKASSDIIMTYSNELQSVFEYTLEIVNLIECDL